jgi:hypothetical protein
MPECFICLQDNPEPIATGCACRGSAGYAHADCKINHARLAYLANPAALISLSLWNKCPTCNQLYTGHTQEGLARGLIAFAREPEPGRAAMGGLATRLWFRWLYDSDRYTEALTVGRRYLDAITRATIEGGYNLPPSDEDVLQTKSCIALINSRIGQFSAAEEMERTVLRQRMLALPPEFEIAAGDRIRQVLVSRCSLALYLQLQGKHAEGDPLELNTMEQAIRVFGQDDQLSLAAKTNHVRSLVRIGDQHGAAKTEREVFDSTKRKLGHAHPLAVRSALSLSTILERLDMAASERVHREMWGALKDERIGRSKVHVACGLATNLASQGRFDEALQIAQPVADDATSVLGHQHTETRRASECIFRISTAASTAASRAAAKSRTNKKAEQRAKDGWTSALHMQPPQPVSVNPPFRFDPLGQFPVGPSQSRPPALGGANAAGVIPAFQTHKRRNPG